MRKSRFTDEQIIRLLHEHEAGRKAAELCREHSISEAWTITVLLYRWKAKCGGMTLSEAKRLKSLEDENRRLKRLFADQALGLSQALKGALAKKY
jgi:putative transposase